MEIDHTIGSFYEDKVQDMAAFLNTTHQILHNFQESVVDTRFERDETRAELRENLAKNRSLRRKDFDAMMQNILLLQAEKENEAKTLLNDYLNEQSNVAGILRDCLAEVRNALANGEAIRTQEYRELIQGILQRQEERKIEVSRRLKAFQEEQHTMVERLKSLLSKGRELRIQDFKKMLQRCGAQRQERIYRNLGRHMEIATMLDGFKKERVDAVRTLRASWNRTSSAY